MSKKVYLALLAVALVLAGAALFVSLQPEPEARGFPIQYGNFVAPDSDSYIKLWDGADLTAYSDEGSTQTFSLDGATGNLEFEGTLDLDGEKMDLDADADTSITADTDDQIDLELGGADVFTLKQWGASTITTDTTTHLFEVFDSTPVMTAGTNSLVGINVDLGIGNSTAGTNSVYGILVDGITGDAQNTEDGISVGSGWDYAADLDGPVTIDGGVTDIGGGSYATANGDNDLGVAGDLEVDGASDLDGTLNVAGAVTLQDDLIVDDTFNVDDTAYALTGTQTLTPTASTYVISSASAVTITLATSSASAGDFLWLVDNTAQAVVIVDTTATAGGSDRTLGIHDVIGFIFDGTIWVEAFYSDNS